LFSVSTLIVGFASDRVRTRWLLLGMALLWSIAQLPLALGGGVALLFGSRILLGAAEGPAFPMAEHSALSWFADDRRNLPSALILSGTALGLIISAPTLTWLTSHHGWRAAFGAVGVAGVAWAAAWLALGAEDRVTRTTAGRAPAGQPRHGFLPAGERTGLRRILATPTWVGATIAYFCTYWALALSLVWIPSYLHDAVGYSPATAANLVAGIWALNTLIIVGHGAVAGRLLRRGIDSRWVRARFGALALAMAGLGSLALPALGRGPGFVLVLLLGLGPAGAMVTISVTSVAELAPPARRGSTLSVMNTVATLSGLIAPALVGHLVDANGTRGYRDAFELTGAILLAGAIAAAALINPSRDARRLASDPQAVSLPGTLAPRPDRPLPLRKPDCQIPSKPAAARWFRGEQSGRQPMGKEQAMDVEETAAHLRDLVRR
jgi:predicted MFS family arabinose efflux permease